MFVSVRCRLLRGLGLTQPSGGCLFVSAAPFSQPDKVMFVCPPQVTFKVALPDCPFLTSPQGAVCTYQRPKVSKIPEPVHWDPLDWTHGEASPSTSPSNCPQLSTPPTAFAPFTFWPNRCRIGIGIRPHVQSSKQGIVGQPSGCASGRGRTTKPVDIIVRRRAAMFGNRMFDGVRMPPKPRASTWSCSSLPAPYLYISCSPTLAAFT